MRLAVFGAHRGTGQALTRQALEAGHQVVAVTRRAAEYPEGIANILAAMEEHDVQRVVAVSSASTYPRRHSEGGVLLNWLLHPLVVATIGRTTYADTRRMESLLRTSRLDWTVVRPSGLFDANAVSDYRVEEDHSDGVFTSRVDLAAAMLAQLTTKWVHRIVAVTTIADTPTVRQLLLREALSRN